MLQIGLATYMEIKMNKYDERYIFRLGNISDIDNIMCFIREHWDNTHILSKDRAFFEYEFLENNTVNVMLAIDRETNTIEAIAGFLKCSNTVPREEQDVWGSFWKVNNTTKNMTFLGVELIKRLMDILQCRNHLGIGINPKTTLPLRKVLFHEQTEKMKHYYMLNPEIEDYKIARINKKYNVKADKTISSINITRLKEMEEVCNVFSLDNIKNIPYKDFWYIERRYFKHPYYHYQVYGLSQRESPIETLVVLREIEQNDRKIIRIVDCIGNFRLLAGCNDFFNKLMSEKGYEYLDFYNLGIDKEIIITAGFKERDEEDVNIIPNYFEPFEQKNVDIWVRYKDKNTVFCKADGDQDRPRLIRY